MSRHRLSRLALASSLAVVLVLPVFAEPTKIKVDGSVIKGYITYLASDASLGRRTLTPGYEKAAEWAAAKFKEWGLKPAGENGTYFQKVPIAGARSAYVWTTGIPSLVVNGRTFYQREGSFAVDAASTAGAKVDAQVVFVGYGISAPAKGLDEYAGVDVKGKIVLALKGSPTTAPTPRVQFAPAPAPEAPRPAGAKDEWAEETTDKAKVMTAYAKGAAAVMLYNPDPAPAAGMFVMGGMGGRGEPLDAAAFTRPFLYVSNVDDSVFRWIMWRDPQESQRGFSARLRRHARRHQGQEGAFVSHRRGGLSQGLRHGDALRRAVQEQLRAQRHREDRGHGPDPEGRVRHRGRPPRSQRHDQRRDLQRRRRQRVRLGDGDGDRAGCSP